MCTPTGDNYSKFKRFAALRKFIFRIVKELERIEGLIPPEVGEFQKNTSI